VKLAITFSLGTPAKYISNNQFYAKSGFVKTKEEMQQGLLLNFYEKQYSN